MMGISGVVLVSLKLDFDNENDLFHSWVWAEISKVICSDKCLQFGVLEERSDDE